MYVAGKDKTCTTPGYTAHKACTECDYTEGKSTIAPGHTWGEYVYDNNATTTADGTKTRTCSGCGAKQSITATGTKLPAPAPEVKPVVDTSKVFNDVVADEWYKEYVDYAYTHKIFVGNEDGTFKPLANITRAEFVQVLANLSGVDTSNKKVLTKFADVAWGEWYTPAIKWAYEKGIVAGRSTTHFGPNEVITREEMCVMIVRYATYRGVTLYAVESKQVFADDSAISDWAKSAVYICQQADIVNGKLNNVFDPAGTGIRAEASVIFTKLHQEYLK